MDRVCWKGSRGGGVHAQQIQGRVFSEGSEAPQAAQHTRTLLRDPETNKKIFKIQKYAEIHNKSMKIHLIPGCPATSEFLRSRIAIIARIPGYMYPDISPDTIHQPVNWFQIRILEVPSPGWGQGGCPESACATSSQLTSVAE